jgi:hypothetical protein
VLVSDADTVMFILSLDAITFNVTIKEMTYGVTMSAAFDDG